MDMTGTDILVSGGGPAGLIAAAAFAAEGFTVTLTDPAPPVTEETAPGADLRTTAFLQPAQALLDRVGLWDRLAPHATPLARMAIAELRPDGSLARHDFDAADISDAPFGWNLPNWLIRREAMALLSAAPGVELRLGTGTGATLARDREVLVTLSDGARLRARLVVAADGRNSSLRREAGIGVHTLRYGQSALSFAVTHPEPHGNVSTEIHRDGGPFTLVPLSDRDGAPCSAVVWMTRGPEANRLAALPAKAFSEAATERSGGLLGPLTLASPVGVWPIVSQLAERLTGPRLALIAEAAHAVPPIGAQGLNMSLADIATLCDLAAAAPGDLGSPTMLDSYARRRRPDLAARVAGIDALNRASMAGAEPLRQARARATALLHDIAPLRRGVMRLGLGRSV
ncbi:UbiH/UbiF family hydroxylase [Rhodobacterales bacterium HKCCE2091]|nr:UbiH/UbiF family hydroxylase [Rhodobacterales bacterium HKCCE2091]